MKKKWLKGSCPVCNATYEYLEGTAKPKTCGKFDCLQKANKQGLFTTGRETE